MTAFYNEIDPFAAAWLRELIKAGHIAPGVVDERSIVDIRPSELDGYTQCHFFAGIGVWSYALRQAGWADDRPIWTGSCPCQPFSTAGKGGGDKDERHLWPAFHELIRECLPSIVMGEQVASHLVIGRYRGNDVQSLWQARQFLDICQDWYEGHFPVGLQGLPKFGGACVFQDEAAEYRDASEQVGGRCEEQSEGTQSSVRSGYGMGTRSAGSWALPAKRQALRSNGKQEHEHALFGSDRSEGRVPEVEHAGHLVRTECCSGHVGTRKTFRSSKRGDEDAIERLNDLISEVGADIEAEDGSSWLDALYLDLGRDGYSCGACVTPAAGVGAPHIRQRLWWVAKRLADANDAGLERRQEPGRECTAERTVGAGSVAGGLADTNGGNAAGNNDRSRMADAESSIGANRVGINGSTRQHVRTGSRSSGGNGVRPNTARDGEVSPGNVGAYGINAELERPGPTNGLWRDADWLFCRDGKWRPVEPGTSPLAHGAPARVGRLRGYGNGLVAPQAQAFIEAIMEADNANCA